MAYVGGGFSQAGAAPASNVARFDTSTQTWGPLGNGAANGVSGAPFSWVRAIAVSGSSVYVGGFFTQAGDTLANRVARFDTNTQTWTSLGSGVANGVRGGGTYVYSYVNAIAVSGSTLYVGGGFSEAGGGPAISAARFDTSTQTWAPLGSGAANGVLGGVNALATSADGTLYVGGIFGSAGGQASSHIASYRPEGLIFISGFE
jgi:hypothetical protein